MSVRFIDYQGKQILYIDLEGTASDFEIIDVGEKAKKLVGISRRKEVYVMYNMTSVKLTRHIMVRLSKLMANASLVNRRVIFGISEKFEPLVYQLLKRLDLDKNTKFGVGYTDAINTIVDDEEWTEAKREEIPEPLPEIPSFEFNKPIPPEEFEPEEFTFDLDFDKF